jgi:hypothetical protein
MEKKSVEIPFHTVPPEIPAEAIAIISILMGMKKPVDAIMKIVDVATRMAFAAHEAGRFNGASAVALSMTMLQETRDDLERMRKEKIAQLVERFHKEILEMLTEEEAKQYLKDYSEVAPTLELIRQHVDKREKQNPMILDPTPPNSAVS